MSKRLKIAMFFSSDASQAGGVQEHVYYLSKHLSDLGHEVTVLGPEKNILPYINYKSVAKSLVIPLPSGNRGNITIENENSKKIFRKINKNYDIVHIHEPYIPFVSWELMKLIKIPKIVTYHATWDRNSGINLLNSFVPLLKHDSFETVKGSIFVSSRTRECWEEAFEIKGFKKIIANGVNLNVFKSNNFRQEKRINILFMARIVPKKGLRYLIKAFEKVLKKNKDVFLSVVGDGSEKEYLENYVESKDLSNYIKFFGYVNNIKKPLFFQKADIFCAPYINEGFGITILEAMASGIPIVAFRNDAFEEILGKYPHKELIVKKNVGNLYHALEKIIEDKKTRENLKNWELKEVQKYSWKKIAREIEEFYIKILNHG